MLAATIFIVGLSRVLLHDDQHAPTWGAESSRTTAASIATIYRKRILDAIDGFDGVGGDVVLVGLSRCLPSGGWVVDVAVGSPQAVVPASGPGGTPVLAFTANLFSAL